MKLKNPILLPVIERLERNLENLSFCCSPGPISEDDDAARDVLKAGLLRGISGSSKLGWWPSRELLQEIEFDVLVLSGRKSLRTIFPAWKAFEQVNKRMPELRLKLRVGNLIRRARKLLSSESELDKVVRLAIAGTAQAQCFYRDKVLIDPQKLAELLRAALQLEKQRCMAQPLLRWLVGEGHPQAKDLQPLIAEFCPTVEQYKVWRRREKTRSRVQRHRSGQKNSPESVTSF
jgi:hypothetical protein